MSQNVFRFSKLRLDVQVADGPRTIVDDVSGECKSGQTLAILGPSGAGKTSLLNVLTLNATHPGSKSFGKCTLNGNQINQKLFQKHCVFVEQLDNHRAFLTPRQSLRYALDFYSPNATAAEKDEEATSLLTKLGLEICADTKIGNLFMQGLSGGQKKRLSVALALVKKPEVLFLDEPTSGLDAAASSNVMKYIRELAADMNIVVVLTIHQPSSNIYMSFDRVMILSQGRTAFFGSPKGSVDYFNEIGHPVPELSNPAEHLLDVVNAEFTSESQVTEVLDRWGESGGLTKKYSSDLLSNLDDVKVSEIVQRESDTLSKPVEMMHVLRRQGHIAFTDPMIYLGRAVGFLMACTFFAVIYVESRERVQDQVLNRLWLSMWFAGVPTSMGVVAVYAYAEEFALVKKEVKNGMYSLSSYLIASFLLQMPAMFTLAVFAIGIPGFAIGNMYAPNFGSIIALYTVLYFSYECIARCMSVTFPNPLLGMLAYLNTWFTSFLFAGVMIPKDEVIWPFRTFVYILPLNWSVKTVAYLDAIDATYEGAYTAGCLETDSTRRGDCIYHLSSSNARIYPGWTCSKDESVEYNPMQCYGKEGWQVLDSLGKNYDSITSDDEVDINFGIIITIALVMWIQYVIFAYIQVGAVSNISDEAPPVLPGKAKKGYEMVAANSVAVTKEGDEEAPGGTL